MEDLPSKVCCQSLHRFLCSLKSRHFCTSTHPRLILAERAIFEKIGYRREFLKATVSGAEPELGQNRKVTLKL